VAQQVGQLKQNIAVQVAVLLAVLTVRFNLVDRVEDGMYGPGVVCNHGVVVCKKLAADRVAAKTQGPCCDLLYCCLLVGSSPSICSGIQGNKGGAVPCCAVLCCAVLCASCCYTSNTTLWCAVLS
jgi:hypothetical protein